MRRASMMLSPIKGRAGGLLFTPGPLLTSQNVKQAMLEDWGSRDKNFVQCITDIRKGLLDVATADEKEWAAIPLQGSGTMGLEATLATTAPPNGKANVLVLRNGSYGDRLAAISNKLGHNTAAFDVPEGQPVDLEAFELMVQSLKDVVTNVVLVHCETSTGMFNPVAEMSAIIRKHAPQATIMIDAMSSFGAVPLNVPDVCDVMVSSANKCIQGVPGFSVIVARRTLLAKTKGWSPSFTLDLVSQCEGLDKNGQFNHTPPVHAIVAFRQALREHTEEGGVAGRANRYRQLSDRTRAGMKELGFTLFLDEQHPSFGYIITSYDMPEHPNWDFMTFYDKLKTRGVVIYPGKASKANTFRIGSIGDLHMPDVELLLSSVKSVLGEMNVTL